MSETPRTTKSEAIRTLAAYGHAACDRVEQLETELAEAKAEIERLREALIKLQREHYINEEDHWYSCPVSGQCSNENAGSECNCGADQYNRIIGAALAAERGE